MDKINMAWIQGKWHGNVATTQQIYLEQARSLQGQKVDLLVLPEFFHTPYFPITEDPKNFDYAISKEDSIVEAWQQIAQELNCVVVFPFFEKRARGVYQNSAFVFERDGSVAGLYRKTHIPDDPCFYEKYYFMPGDTGFKPIKTSAGTLGILICWDQWFPEAARILALQGAELLIYPTAIAWDANEPEALYPRQLKSWQTSMQGHAIANGVFVLAVNRVGSEDNLDFWGHSFVSEPDGHIASETDHKFYGVAQHSINFSEIENQRQAWPFMRDRRVCQYEMLLKQWGTP
ncbi:MAG: carbon-nitrogen hydrolase [Fibrobacter sp.]|nr:carbon-nitrogen hydrolase [Fibrobacter sp.]